MTSVSRKPIRILRYLFIIGVLFQLVCPTAQGKRVQLPGGVWRVYLSKQVPVTTQRTPVWCWAASLSALFGYFGHPVDQARIVAKYFPPPGITTGPPWVMRDALNSVWVDDSGNRFQVTSRITNLYPPAGPRQVENPDILSALENEIPVFYGDSTHAMVLVQADYRETPYGPNILAGWAIDPFPNPTTGVAYGFRQLQINGQVNEMQALFAAIPSVTDEGSGTTPEVRPPSGDLSEALNKFIAAGRDGFRTIKGSYLSRVGEDRKYASSLTLPSATECAVWVDDDGDASVSCLMGAFERFSEAETKFDELVDDFKEALPEGWSSSEGRTSSIVFKSVTFKGANGDPRISIDLDRNDYLRSGNNRLRVRFRRPLSR